MRRMPTNEEINQIKQNASDIADIKSKYNIMENIVDAQGHNRFVEDDIVATNTPTGITYTYLKWSLSGTHLMVVASMEIEAEAVIPEYAIKLSAVLPEWILDKINPTVSSFVSNARFYTTESGAAPTSNYVDVYLYKSANALAIENLIGITGGTTKEILRIQFDLIIDNASE